MSNLKLNKKNLSVINKICIYTEKRILFNKVKSQGNRHSAKINGELKDPKFFLNDGFYDFKLSSLIFFQHSQNEILFT